MRVAVSFNRIKQGNTITEVISWTPNHSYLRDASRLANHVIWIISTKKSIANKYKLLDQVYSDNKIINTLEYNTIYDDKPKLSELFYFDYFPTLDKKKCTTCTHYRKTTKQYCVLRGLVLNKDYWHKCLYWEEGTCH